MERLYKNKKKLLWYLIKNYNITNAEDVLDFLLIKFYEKSYNKYDAEISGIETFFIHYLKMEMRWIMRNKKYDEKLRKIVEFEDIDLMDEVVVNEYSIEKLNSIIPYLNNIQTDKRSIGVKSCNYEKWYKYLVDNSNGKLIKEIAEEEGVNVNTIKSRMDLTRKQIRKVYKLKYKI